ncbi:multifunctional CCA addition/repair protein [Methylosoma difficile]
MQIYLVGGAVRDQLLGYPVIERDWLVIGETPESMLAQGFRPVGKDFPVFLHPDNNEEYALARTERKTAPGYKGFVIHAEPDISLEQDLLRRDLTINAMALDEDGQVIDPYGGQQDLQQRIFRHVSPAFAEDPVRILRLARFAARYAHLGFTLAEETRAMMQQMVEAGEVDYLVPERVWAELFKALNEQTPAAFFETLNACGALAKIFPEIHALFGVPQPEQHHPEIDTGIHSLMSLQQAVLLSDNPEVRFAALVHDLGKALSPKDNLPHHYGHENAGLPILETFCKRLRVPNSFRVLALQVMQYHTHCHRVFDLRASTIVDMMVALGVTKPKNNFALFLLACEADAKGRTGFETRDYNQVRYLSRIAAALQSVDTSSISKSGLQGPQIGEAIRRLRIKAVRQAMNAYQQE